MSVKMALQEWRSYMLRRFLTLMDISRLRIAVLLKSTLHWNKHMVICFSYIFKLLMDKQRMILISHWEVIQLQKLNSSTQICTINGWETEITTKEMSSYSKHFQSISVVTNTMGQENIYHYQELDSNTITAQIKSITPTTNCHHGQTTSED